jgi:hypothetical protein
MSLAIRDSGDVGVATEMLLPKAEQVWDGGACAAGLPLTQANSSSWPRDKPAVSLGRRACSSRRPYESATAPLVLARSGCLASKRRSVAFRSSCLLALIFRSV